MRAYPFNPNQCIPKLKNKCSDGLRVLLKFYNKYNDHSIIDRFDRIGPFRTFYSVESDAISKVGDLQSLSRGVLPIEKKLARVKENFVFAEAEAFDHIQSKFDKNMQVTKEDFEILKPIQRLFNDIGFASKYAQLMKNTSESQILDVDELSY